MLLEEKGRFILGTRDEKIIYKMRGDFSSTQHWLGTENNTSSLGEITLNEVWGEMEESGVEQQKWSKVQKYDL